MRVILVYNQFLDEKTIEPTIGGIQTYICDLCDLLIERQHTVVILQQANNANCYEWNGCKVQNIKSNKNDTKTYKNELKKYFDKELLEDDLIIFMTHTLSFPIANKRAITIQHGIYWDIPRNKPRSSAIVEFLFRSIHSWKEVKEINQTDYCVAVDYNFLNWYKTQQYFLRSNIKVIPNYSAILEPRKVTCNNNDSIKILFARRFERYRGTQIYAEAVEAILNEYPNVVFSFAGSGPEEKGLKERFANEDRVDFIKYSHNESLEVHSKYDIAVVASIGSEGTSLSLLEGMASGCAVIATNVGGLTNIVINGYNGILSDINADSLIRSLKQLITDESLRKRVSQNGYETVKWAFSKDRWKGEWTTLIRCFEEN